MMLTIETKPVPLSIENDVVMVTGTRIPIDTIVHAYLRGDTAEEIAESYDTLKLAQIYAVIAYYLDHQEDVDTYLKRRVAQQEESYRYIDDYFDQDDFRRRLLTLREKNAKTGR
jgi:uncharacterized protein (DUF433 family)